MNNRLAIEVLHARRPMLNYVSPAICEASFSGSSFAVVVLESSSGLSPVAGVRVNFASGRFNILWNAYPSAVCYNVYRANDSANIAGTYTLVADCVPDTSYSTPDCPACFLITAVTVKEGETPFGTPVCTKCP